mmetsp:Transcript_31202/g.79547  ORF Transcript_31202/g.79547 Transcript_31202/m.79547 type:complete len:240 (+) Transcript_31202:342-1061(+)
MQSSTLLACGLWEQHHPGGHGARWLCISAQRGHQRCGDRPDARVAAARAVWQPGVRSGGLQGHALLRRRVLWVRAGQGHAGRGAVRAGRHGGRAQVHGGGGPRAGAGRRVPAHLAGRARAARQPAQGAARRALGHHRHAAAQALVVPGVRGVHHGPHHGRGVQPRHGVQGRPGGPGRALQHGGGAGAGGAEAQRRVRGQGGARLLLRLRVPQAGSQAHAGDARGGGGGCAGWCGRHAAC